MPTKLHKGKEDDGHTSITDMQQMEQTPKVAEENATKYTSAVTYDAREQQIGTRRHIMNTTRIERGRLGHTGDSPHWKGQTPTSHYKVHRLSRKWRAGVGGWQDVLWMMATGEGYFKRRDFHQGSKYG